MPVPIAVRITALQMILSCLTKLYAVALRLQRGMLLRRR